MAGWRQRSRRIVGAACLVALHFIALGSVGAEPRWTYLGDLALLRETPDLKVNRYHVHGASADELRRELDAKGPADWDGKRGDAFTHWKVVWRWPKDSQGRPHFDRAFIKTEIHVTLPQWNAPAEADPRLKEDWESFMQALIQHERGHVRHALSLRPRIQERILARTLQSEGLTLAEANKIARQVVDEIREEDRAFDARTDYGRLEGVRFPRVR